MHDGSVYTVAQFWAMFGSGLALFGVACICGARAELASTPCASKVFTGLCIGALCTALAVLGTLAFLNAF